MARRRILKKLARVLIVVVALVVAIFALSLYVMARKDKEHARFFNTGKSVNQFLATYKHGLEEAFKKKDVSEITRFYSSRYASPGRGRWVLKPDQNASDVACLVLTADGRKDYAKADLEDEFKSYLNGLASVQDIKFNIKEHGSQLKFGVIEHGGGGVSAVDYNNDGKPDIFFADGKRSRLYRNDGTDSSGRIHFTDVTQESGLDGIDQAAAGIFADVDNDGYQDLFVSRYLAPLKFYHNNGPDAQGKITFSDWSAKMGFDPKDPKSTAPAVSACFLDYDRDGYVDLYVGLYGDAFKDVPRLPFYAQNGGANRLYHNDGGKRFIDVTEKSGTGDTGWTLAVAAADYDNDGYPDLATANDFGRKNLYHNNHDGTFTEVAKQAGVLDFSGGMGLTWGDFDDDGRLDLYTSNINSNQRWFGEDMTVTQYMRNVIRTKYAITDLGEYWKVYKLLGPRWAELGKMIGEGNRLFHNNGDGTFQQVKDSHTNRAGWGWSVAFFDYDNDTKLDIYAANGWISNAPNTDL